jgi:hypothetical protein
MNRGTLWIVLLSICALAVAGCGGSSHRVTITTAPSTLAAGASSNVVAVTSHDSSDQINWSCAPSGACGSFNPTPTQSGTGSTYTAPPVAPSGGSVMITATSTDHPSRSDTVSIAITGVAAQNFVFSATGEENTTFDLYSIAGVVAIASDGSGTVVGGEQDYNDGDVNTSPQPSGDAITGGSLVMAGDGSGNGVLTLITNNSALGVEGTETFAVVFANNNHALIVQFDGSATSSGSMDLQTATSAPAGSFAFTASGLEPSDGGSVLVGFGGVLAIDGSGNVTGFFDENNGGLVTMNNSIPAGSAASAPDSFGRGIVTGATGADSAFNYYVVGPEVIRVIDVGTTSTAIGSAYGQGTSAGTFTSGSIGASVFSVANSEDLYAGVGEISNGGVIPTVKRNTQTHIPQGGVPCSGAGAGVSCEFDGVADVNELQTVLLPAQEFTGSFSISAAGNGFIAIDDGDLADIVTLGVYVVDPTLNILDPNDTTDSLGGALVSEMDANLVGTGSLVPQPSGIDPADFSGPYAFGAQGDTADDEDEFDFVGAAVVNTDGGSFSGVGALSDPFAALSTGGQSTNATFNGVVAADIDNSGRFTIAPLTIAASDESFDTVTPTVTVYEANASQFVWIEMDTDSFWSGPLETSTVFSDDAVKRAKAKAKTKKH